MEDQDTLMNERWISEESIDQTPIGNGTNPSTYEHSISEICDEELENNREFVENISKQMKFNQISRSSSPDILITETPKTLREKPVPRRSLNDQSNKKRPGSTSLEENDAQRPIFEFIPNKADTGKKVFAAQYKPETVKACMDLAFNMVLRAMYLSEDMNEKQNLHDISVVHREYQESGKIGWARSILGQEIRALERISRNLGSQVQSIQAPRQQQQLQQLKHTVQKLPTAASKLQHQPSVGVNTQSGGALTFAQIAAKNNQPNQQNQNWTQVTYQKQPKPTVGGNKKKSRQLVLITPESPNSDINSMTLRNNINNAFTKAGAQKPVILTVGRSLVRRNIVLTTTESFTAEYLLEKKAIWEHLVPHTTCQVNEPWHKVVIHGVPTADFDNDNLVDMVKNEIQTFNHGLKVIGAPYWLTAANRRPKQYAGSIVVAFATEKEATTAIRNRLYMAGRSLKVEKLYAVSPTTQCNKCQGFGHLDNKCTRPEKCQICAGGHHTSQHKCSSCPARGKACVHTLVKCANCNQNHKANDISCEVFRSLKDRTSLITEVQMVDSTTASS